jgi:hypothetical protein
MFSQDGNTGPNGQLNTVVYGSSHATFQTPGIQGVLGRRKLTDVLFPSGKVQLYDGQDRHSGNVQLFFADRRAKQPLLMFDQSVGDRATADSNHGWKANTPRQDAPATGLQPNSNAQWWAVVGQAQTISYDARGIIGEAATTAHPSAQGSSLFVNPASSPRDTGAVYTGVYVWTRGGLRGADFGTGQIRTANWQ